MECPVLQRACLLAVSLILALPAVAQESRKPAEPETPITQKDVSASDVVTTPVTDLNLRKGEIPPLLLDAQSDPYDLSGMTSCGRIASAVSAFDAILGDDLDITADHSRKPQAGRVAQSVVASFIPFRGVIREVSGASAQERRMQGAIMAGSVRRGFLKGVGEQRGCRYPARSATEQVVARRLADIAAADPGNREKRLAAEQAARAIAAKKRKQ